MKRSIFLFILLAAWILPLQLQAQFTEYVPTGHRLYKEPPESWRNHLNYVPIFNGRNFDGWEITGDSKWEVTEGAMVARPGNPEATTRGMAGSRDEFSNFILRFQYSIEPDPNIEPENAVNSGVFFRVPRDSRRKATDGYEMEIAADDDYEYPTGSIWRLARAYPGLSHANLWNDAEIFANGDFIRISVNGQVAMEIFDRRSSRGMIWFQHQRNGLVKYRNIEVMRLPESGPLPPTIEEELEQAPGDFVSLFNGRDLAGWVAYGEVPEALPSFSVDGGEIVLEPDSGKGFLAHQGVFGDFILKVRFMMPDDGDSREGDSGVFVRSESDGAPNGLEAQIENVRDWHHWNPTGSIYGLSQGLFGWFKFNDWNEYTIYVKGERMAVYLNGQKTASALVGFNARARRPFSMAGCIKIEAIEPFHRLRLRDILIKEVK